MRISTYQNYLLWLAPNDGDNHLLCISHPVNASCRQVCTFMLQYINFSHEQPLRPP